MFDLYELLAFAEFSDCGTLSKTAERLHISQPTLTRAMQHIEAEFQVPLFLRTKNKIELNETGKMAAEQAKRLLSSVEDMEKQVRSFDRSLHTITVESCAPAPLWSLLPLLASLPANAGATIASSLREMADIEADLDKGDCRIGILAADEKERLAGDPEWMAGLREKHFRIIPYLQENLFLSLRKDHPLADRKEVSFTEIDGMTFLVRSELGFWGKIHQTTMPRSRFLEQQEEAVLLELLQNSTIPGFVTNLSMLRPTALADRVYVPISDPEAHITYYLAAKEDDPARKTSWQLW